MRNIVTFMAPFMFMVLLTTAGANAQSPPARDLGALFEAVQKAGTESELRGDIADRLGFGEHPLLIKDLVIRTEGVQHAVNAFMVSGRPYLLFDSHLSAPEIYIFIKSMDGAFVSGIHGPQYAPITDTVDMTGGNATPVVGAEEAFWLRWLADGAKPPAN